jgi:bile acid:Na+ symporter, BASS family
MGAPLLKPVVDVGVPVLVFFAMVVVGMELTVDDFRRVARRPGTVLTATVGQLVLLPVIGWLLVRCLGLQPAIARGVLLVAACPSGGMANVYTYLARANVALSVTLTAVSCLAAVLTTPLALAVLRAGVGESTGFPVPFAVLAGQLFLLLVLPVLTGMGIRRRWPALTKRHGRALLGCSIATLAVLLGFIIVQEAEHFAGALTDLAAAVALLTVLALGAGWATAWASGAEAADRFTVGMVFVVRNVGIATAIAVTVLGRVEFAVFATAYFLAQAPILLGAVLVFRRLRVSEPNKREEVDHP